ncbi:MAG: hypothetical protein IJZ57_05795 [Clostridia bacterium]|nr:hypothetical protein [Clostridia bacterium]
MIKIADLLIDWQNDSTDFADKFISNDTGKAVMSVSFAEKMPECHGVQYIESPHLLKNDMGQVLCANSDWSEIKAYYAPRSDNDFSLPLAAVCARFAEYKVLLLHASLVSFNGQGILFTGSSGVGKTTQAELWNTYLNADIINGDKALVRQVGGEFVACGLPWKGSSDYCLNENVPIKGIIVLSQAKENRITRFDNVAAEKLLPHIFLPHWDENCLDKALNTFDALVSHIPVWHLACRPDEEAVKITCDAIKM